MSDRRGFIRKTVDAMTYGQRADEQRIADDAKRKLLDELLAEIDPRLAANQKVGAEKNDQYFYGAAYGLGVARAIIEKKREELK